MKVLVKVMPRARQEKLQPQADGSIKVWVRVVPEKGRANERVVELLADHFCRPKSQVQLIRGGSSGHKIFEIL